MQKVKWIIGLTLTGILAISGVAYALSAGSSNTVAASYSYNASTATPAGTGMEEATPAFYATNKNTVNAATPGPNGNDPSTGTGYGGYGYGMMGGSFGPGSGFGMMQGNAGTGYVCGGYNGNQGTSDNAGVQNDTKASLHNAQVDKAANSITYTGQNVKIVIQGGPEQADGKFVIAGLVNPTLHIPKGDTVTVEFANADAGMPHAFEITNAAPPYAYMSMMNGGVYPGSFIAPLPAAQKNQFPVTQTTFNAEQSGTYYYICQYPGHAAKGMYGKIVIN